MIDEFLRYVCVYIYIYIYIYRSAMYFIDQRAIKMGIIEVGSGRVGRNTVANVGIAQRQEFID
jgi:hypothetical protein